MMTTKYSRMGWVPCPPASMIMKIRNLISCKFTFKQRRSSPTKTNKKRHSSATLLNNCHSNKFSNNSNNYSKTMSCSRCIQGPRGVARTHGELPRAASAATTTAPAAKAKKAASRSKNITTRGWYTALTALSGKLWTWLISKNGTNWRKSHSISWR